MVCGAGALDADDRHESEQAGSMSVGEPEEGRAMSRPEPERKD